MASSPPLGSIDLAMTRYTGAPSQAPLESADSWGSLDFKLVPAKARGRTVSGLDLDTVGERANLGQALILRLLTLQGSLTALGHPDYGCRLVSLIGRTNNDTTRHLARLYVIEAVRQERRVKALTALSVDPAPGQPDTLLISMSVVPLGDDDPLSLALEIAL
jgi:phage baseplate assembly protein W